MKKLMMMIMAVIPFGIVAQDANDSYALVDDAFTGLFADATAYSRSDDDTSVSEFPVNDSAEDEIYEVNDLLLADPDFEVEQDMISYTKDQKTVFFSANKKLRLNSKNVDDLKIKKSVQLHLFRADVKENGEWVNLEMLPFNGSRHSTGHPALNEDDTKLYFVSDGPESIGKTDIFVVDLLEDGTYGEPENLGSKINSLEREVYPYIDEESVLYFASDVRTEGEKLDVFATRVVDDEPGVPVRLDVPFSTAKEGYLAAFRALDSESLQLAEEGPEMNVMAPAEVVNGSSVDVDPNFTPDNSNETNVILSETRETEKIIMEEDADNQQDLEILSEAERLAEIAPREEAYNGSNASDAYDFDSDRIVYTVQIGAFLKNVNNGVYQNVNRVFSHSYNDGYNRFYSGIFYSPEEALAHLKEIQQDGFDDAFVLRLKGNKRYLGGQ